MNSSNYSSIKKNWLIEIEHVQVWIMKHTAQNMLHKIFNKTFKNLQLKVKASSQFQVHSVKVHLSETRVREALCCTTVSEKFLLLPNIWFNLCIKVSAELLLRWSDVICNQLHRTRRHWNQRLSDSPQVYYPHFSPWVKYFVFLSVNCTFWLQWVTWV